MTELTELKKLPILRAMVLMGEGKGKIEACTECGISYRTFDRMLVEYPDLINEIVPVQQNEVRIRLEKILKARADATDKIILRASSENLSLKELIALDDKLATLQLQAEQQLGISHDEDSKEPAMDLQAAQNFLDKGVGVRLQPGISKITQTVEFQLEKEEESEVVEGKFSPE